MTMSTLVMREIERALSDPSIPTGMLSMEAKQAFINAIFDDQILICTEWEKIPPIHGQDARRYNFCWMLLFGYSSPEVIDAAKSAGAKIAYIRPLTYLERSLDRL